MEFWIDINIKDARKLRQKKIKEGRKNWHLLPAKQQEKIVQLQLQENWYLNRENDN